MFLNPVLQGIGNANILVELGVEITRNIVIGVGWAVTIIIESRQAELSETQIRFDARRRLLGFAQRLYFIVAEVIALFLPPGDSQGNCGQQDGSYQGAHTAITALPWDFPGW